MRKLKRWTQTIAYYTALFTCLYMVANDHQYSIYAERIATLLILFCWALMITALLKSEDVVYRIKEKGIDNLLSCRSSKMEQNIDYFLISITAIMLAAMGWWFLTTCMFFSYLGAVQLRSEIDKEITKNDKA